jgi:Tfp pilus assembly protein PilO
MQTSQRQRNIMSVLIGALLLLAVDRLAISPFFEYRDSLLLQRDAIEHDVAEAHHVLKLEQDLRPLSRSLASSLNGDPSAVESGLLHLLHQWQQRAGVTNASFARLRGVDSHGFTCLTFNVSATGGMAPIASLIYRIETASIPLRIDDLRLSPKRDGADELQLRLNLSTLCRAGAQTAAAEAVANAVGGPE